MRGDRVAHPTRAVLRSAFLLILLSRTAPGGVMDAKQIRKSFEHRQRQLSSAAEFKRMENLFSDRTAHVRIPPGTDEGQCSGPVCDDWINEKLSSQRAEGIGDSEIDTSANDIRADFLSDYNRYSRRMEQMNGAKNEPLACFGAPIKKKIGEYKFIIEMGTLAHIHSDVVYPDEITTKVGAFALAEKLGLMLSWGFLYE